MYILYNKTSLVRQGYVRLINNLHTHTRSSCRCDQRFYRKPTRHVWKLNYSSGRPTDRTTTRHSQDSQTGIYSDFLCARVLSRLLSKKIHKHIIIFIASSHTRIPPPMRILITANFSMYTRVALRNILVPTFPRS